MCETFGLQIISSTLTWGNSILGPAAYKQIILYDKSFFLLFIDYHLKVLKHINP